MNKYTFLVFILLLSTFSFSKYCYAQTVVPLSLSIVPASKSVPSDGQLHPAFFVVVVDSKGSPRFVDEPLTISITCSDERVLKLPSSVKIGAKSYYALVNGSSSILEQKTVEVTVMASGLQSAKATILVEPPAGTPISLVVTLLPDVLPPDVGAVANVVVTLVDIYGKPTRARSDLTVKIASSNTHVANVMQGEVKIPKGSFSTTSSVKITGIIGSTTITASSPDLKSGSATLTVTGPRPEKLNIWLPQYMVANETSYLPVMIMDKDNRPAKVPYPVTVNLFSSNETVISLPPNVVIETENWFTLVKIKVNYPGVVTLYASSGNMTTSSVQVRVVKSVGYPVTIKGYVLSPNFPTDELKYTGLMIQALNKTGYPCRVNSSTLVSIFSSYSTIFDAQPIATIPVNTSHVFAYAIPKLPGTVKLTFVAPNHLGTEATASVYATIPASTKIIVPPLPSEGTVQACITFSGAGEPAPVQEDTMITLTSSNTKIAEVDSVVTIPKKQYYALFKVYGKDPGSINIYASGNIPSINLPVTVHEVRPSTFYISTIRPLIGTSFPIVVQVLSNVGPPSVVDQLTNVNIVSSNTSSIKVPDSLIIPTERSDSLFYAEAIAVGKTTAITISSSGFTSSGIQISPISYKATFEIITEKSVLAESRASIKIKLTLDGLPIKDVQVNWVGDGLEFMSTKTNEGGESENSIFVKVGENVVQVSAFIPGAGTVSNSTKIIGLRQYTLSVSSNVDANIDISPSSAGNRYREGMKVTLTAPSSVPMYGILGSLGGKYNFAEWTGYTSSKSNPLTIEFKGASEFVSIQAVYVEDY
ncbi:MAG: hypothetical protein QXO82_06350, partial [Candidatus Methanomethylicia archaeon]